MTATRLIRLEDATDRDASAAPCVLVIGNFDGVHRGHQAVLTQAVELARTRDRGVEDRPVIAAALTFDPHPTTVLRSSGPQPLLTTLDDRAELVGQLGVERLYVRRFDAAFAAWSPSRFAEMLADPLAAKAVVVGSGFRFGARRAGDLGLLRRIGAERGFDVVVAEVAGD